MSLLSRCIQSWPWGRKQSQRQSVQSSWPRASTHHSQYNATEEDCAPLLRKSKHEYRHPEKNMPLQPFPCRTTAQRPRSSNYVVSISKTPMTVVLYTLLCIVLLVSPTEGMPITETTIAHLFERQSIPDRFGNTGNTPGVVSPQDANEIGPDGASATITVTATRTISVTPTIDVAASNAPPSSISTSLVLTSISTSTSLPESAESSPIPIPVTTIISSSPTPSDATTTSPAEPLFRTSPISSLDTASLAGIITGGSIFLLLLIGLGIILYKRHKARDIEEIPIRRSKLGSRLAWRVFGNHYDERIARSRTASADNGAGGARFTERRRSSAKSATEKSMTLQVPPQTYGASKPFNGPMSPSVYSPRLTRISTMTFGSMSGWLDKSVIGRPMPAFTGTPSQLLDAPKPLFAKQDKVEDEKWAGKSNISPPRPARPGSAEPLGRLSGMGYGLGLGLGPGNRSPSSQRSV